MAASSSRASGQPAHARAPYSASAPAAASAATSRPIVFLDVQIGPTYHGRLEIELYSDMVPRTAENSAVLGTMSEYSYLHQRTGPFRVADSWSHPGVCLLPHVSQHYTRY